MGLILLVAALAHIGAPTTVNGQVIGKPDDYKVVGPERVCLREASFDLNKNEASYLVYTGIHSQTIQIVGANGTIKLSEGEAWAMPKRPKSLFFKNATMEVYEVEDSDTEFRYLVYARNRYSDGKFVPMIWIDGTSLAEDKSDLDIIRRLSIGDLPIKSCKIKFNYGWAPLMGDEPTVWRHK